MPFVRRLRPIFEWARGHAVLGFEVGAIIMSCMAARVLLTDQQYFDRKPAFQWITLHMTGQEWVWGIIAALAALLKAVGLLCSFARSEETVEYAFIAREIGWGLSAFFWTCLGLSTWIWEPGNITAGNTMLIGVFSFGMAFMGPVMPGRGNDG